MRILLVNDYGAPFYGAELHLLAFRDELRRRGHEVMLFSSRADLVPGVALQADASCFGTTGKWQALSQAANPSAYRALRACIDRFRPDIVHVAMFLWQLSPLIMPLLRNIPSVYQALVYKSICPTGTKLLPDGTQCRSPYGRACLAHRCVTWPTWIATMAQLGLFTRWRSVFDRVIVPSSNMRELLLAGGFDDVRVVPFGFPGSPMRQPLSQPPLVAFAGRLSPEKGVDVLLRAFAVVHAAVPTARLLIAGDGPLAASLRDLAGSLGIETAVEWLGYVPREHLERRFAAAWVQAVPSLWQEPFGNVTAEAMMRGTAVVASDVGGASDIVVDGETGLLVPPGDIAALARALLAMLNDREQAERLGAVGRLSARNLLGETALLETMLGIYAELIISFQAERANPARRPSRSQTVAF